MLQKQTNRLIALINNSQSVVFLLNDLQHQVASLTPHETLPAILAQLELYKKMVLTPAQIIELQSIARDNKLEHAFLYEPPAGIITKDLKENFLSALQQTIEKNVHQAVQAKLTSLTKSPEGALSVETPTGLYNELITSCQTAINSLLQLDLNNPVFKEAKEELHLLSIQVQLQPDIAEIIAKLSKVVNSYPSEVKPEPENKAFQEAKALIVLTDSLHRSFLDFRVRLETFQPKDFAELISNYPSVEKNPIYQVATALEELPKLKRILQERCPAEMKKASVSAGSLPSSARGLTSGAAAKILPKSPEQAAIQLYRQLADELPQDMTGSSKMVVTLNSLEQRPQFQAAWNKLNEWAQEPNRTVTPTTEELNLIFKKFELAPASVTATFTGRR